MNCSDKKPNQKGISMTSFSVILFFNIRQNYVKNATEGERIINKTSVNPGESTDCMSFAIRMASSVTQKY